MSPLKRPDAQDPRWHRLSALDGAFLSIEDAHNLMHIGATAVFEPGTLIDAEGRIDRARYRRYAEAVLARLPKWRHRPARVPLLRHPVLVFDDRFELERHVRFVHLEQGTFSNLERLAGQLFSRMLDRNRPLWEQWVVDGLEGRRFAIITKLHHSMADGVAGLDSLAAMLSTERAAAIPDGRPGPELAPPAPRELLRAELARRASEPRALWERARRAAEHPERTRRTAKGIVAGALSAARTSARPAPKTPLNPRSVGPRRLYRGVRAELDEVKRIKNAAGAKVNDVVLAVVAGALRRFFEQRGVSLPERELTCMVPVNLRPPGNGDVLGNEVSLFLVPLPLAIDDPRQRLQAIAERAGRAKEEGQSFAFASGESFAEWTVAPLIPWAMRAVTLMRPYNVIVTNVPGPPFPLYLLDSQMLEVYPLVPLYRNQAIAIALVSYAGGLFWGINADADRVSDVDVLADALRAELAELSRAVA